MKKISLFIGIVFLSINTLFSQVEPAGEKEVGGFGSIITEMGVIDKQFSMLVGGGGGVIVKNIRMGAFFEGLVNKVSILDISTTSQNRHRLKLSYGGLWVGYPLFKSHRFHALADLKICFGSTATQNSENVYSIENEHFLYGFIPYVGMEFFVTDFFTISAGIDYRFCLFPNRVENHKTTLLNMPSCRIALQLGLF